MAISWYYIYTRNLLIYIVYKSYWLVSMDNLSSDRKSLRRTRRNLVAKDSKFIGNKHPPKNKYSRKSKHPDLLP